MRKNMNKKADITIIVLVLGIIAVCFFAIITFVNSNISTQNSFENLRIIWDMNQKIENGEIISLPVKQNSLGKYYEYLFEEKKGRIFLPSRPKVLFRVRYYPDLN